MKAFNRVLVITLVAAANLPALVQAQETPAPATQLVPCGSSLVLTKCPDQPAAAAPPPAPVRRPAAATPAAPAAPTAPNPCDLSKVVVEAPAITKNSASDTLQNDLANKPRRKPIAGARRDDRDNFGQRTECQQSKLPCNNQPGRPVTTAPGN
ncbi:hypothetical protein BH09PSE6_BH09PSE6_04750 [soil metagenome]